MAAPALFPYPFLFLLWILTLFRKPSPPRPSPLWSMFPFLVPGKSKAPGLGLAMIGQEPNLSHSAHTIPPATVLFQGWTCDRNWPNQIRENVYSMLEKFSLSYFIWGWEEGSKPLPYCHLQPCKPEGSWLNPMHGGEQRKTEFYWGRGHDFVVIFSDYKVNYAHRKK